MSGIEVAGLIFGVLPVIIQIIKSYETTCERLHTFRVHARAIQRIQVRFRVQQSSFRNECRHLLRLVIHDDEELQATLEDRTHSRWRDGQLNEQFQICLGDEYDSCETILKEIQQLLKEIGEDLSRFDRASWPKPEVSASPIPQLS